jgi:hypothetical protein
MSDSPALTTKAYIASLIAAKDGTFEKLIYEGY